MQQTHQHGVFLNIFNTGVLITGPSQIGKSELALNLLERGQQLIADDYVILQKNHNQLIGSCPIASQGFLAIRDIGIINVIKLFGQQAVCTQQIVAFIIKLISEQQTPVSEDTPWQGPLTMQTLMDIEIPTQTILVKPTRNLPLIIETCVRNFLLKQQGYAAELDFLAKQQPIIDNSL